RGDTKGKRLSRAASGCQKPTLTAVVTRLRRLKTDVLVVTRKWPALRWTAACNARTACKEERSDERCICRSGTCRRGKQLQFQLTDWPIKDGSNLCRNAVARQRGSSGDER